MKALGGTLFFIVEICIISVIFTNVRKNFTASIAFQPVFLVYLQRFKVGFTNASEILRKKF